jgi:hypothetical protein
MSSRLSSHESEDSSGCPINHVKSGILSRLSSLRKLTFALAIVCLSGPCAKEKEKASETPDRAGVTVFPPEGHTGELPAAHGSGKQEHMTHHDHPDMAALYQKEVSHPFHTDPETWLKTHEKELEAAFAPTGEFVLRVPGSGVLEKMDEWIDFLAAKAKAMGKATGRPMKIVIESHAACGAAGIAYKGKESPDDCARDDHDVMVEKLRAKGVDAVHGRDSAMSGSPVHTALAATVDFSERMKRPPVNSFGVSSPHTARIPDDALLALAIAAGSHSYGEHLKQFTFICFVDPANRGAAEGTITEIDKRAEEYRRKGIDVRIIRFDAPPVREGDTPTVLRVQCIDERVKPE